MALDPFFGPPHLPKDGDDVFVGWVDLMGVGDAMSRSYETAATNVGKLYSAIATHKYADDMEVYPMADGIYLFHEYHDELFELMANIFLQFGKVTYDRYDDPEDDYGPWLGFLIRGGIAHGTVYHGEDVDEDGESDLADVQWIDHVPFGQPIAYAHHVERGSSPYSIVIHESAADDPGPWRWWDNYPIDIEDMIVEYLDAHFSWSLENIDDLLYEESNLYHHAEKAEEYFELPDGHFNLH